MPISFLEQSKNQHQTHHQMEAKLKARLLLREFASHRFGIFKESGFANDQIYPSFSSLAGKSASLNATSLLDSSMLLQSAANDSQHEQLLAHLKGFDQHWQECNFLTSPSTGLPLPASANCLPYLAKSAAKLTASSSFNLMSVDPFTHWDSSGAAQRASKLSGGIEPLDWRDLHHSTSWHFCGQNFATATNSKLEFSEENQLQTRHLAHNQLASNKQNVMCNERSALDVIKANDDFRSGSFR